MSLYPGLLAGTGLLPQNLADSIAQVVVKFGDPAGGPIERGTGFLYRRKPGVGYLATAAHVIFKHGHGFPGQVTIRFGMRSNGPIRTVTLGTNLDERCFVPAGFSGTASPPADADFGLIRIDDPNGHLANFHAFSVSSVMPTQNIVRLFGYPAHPGAAQSDDPHHAILEVVAAGQSNFEYAHVSAQNDPSTPITYRGMSGGPLIGNSSTDQTNRVFGIHTRGDDGIRAVRMSQPVRTAMRTWIDSQ